MVRDRKVVQKTFVWYNGTLSDVSRTIGVVGVLLEDAMPMLQVGHISKVPNPSPVERFYNRGCQVQGIVVEFIGNLYLEPVTLWNVKIKRKGNC